MYCERGPKPSRQTDMIDSTSEEATSARSAGGTRHSGFHPIGYPPRISRENAVMLMRRRSAPPL